MLALTISVKCVLLELGHYPRNSGISITPLIDVVFILLLFFMLSSTFSRTHQIEVKAASEGGAQAQLGEAKRLLLQDNNAVLLDGKRYRVDSTDLLAQLALLGEQDAEFVIAGTPQVKVQALISLVDMARGAGVVKVNIAESVTQ
jgi:biopolymer transport protein ExbD